MSPEAPQTAVDSYILTRLLRELPAFGVRSVFSVVRDCYRKPPSHGGVGHSGVVGSDRTFKKLHPAIGEGVKEASSDFGKLSQANLDARV